MKSYICSAHFPESCFHRGEGKICLRLDKNAVPSIFPQCPKHLQIIEKKKRKSPAKRKIIEKPYQPSPSKVAKAISLDHPYKSCESAEQKILRLTKQNEALYQRLCQRDKKIKNMKDLLQSLKDKQLILDEQLQNLNQNFGHVAQHLFENYAKNVKKVMTLHYYSPKGYDFVRTILNLPHPSSIHTWAASVDCKPGYLMNVIHCLVCISFVHITFTLHIQYI